MPDLNDAPRALAVLRKQISDTRRLQNEMAKAVLAKARSNAATRPTPQARMVAAGMIVTRGVVLGRANRLLIGNGSRVPVKLGVLAYGAEFGSNVQRQFGPRNESGHWLNPAGERPGPDGDKAEETYLDRAIDAAIRAAL